MSDDLLILRTPDIEDDDAIRYFRTVSIRAQRYVRVTDNILRQAIAHRELQAASIQLQQRVTSSGQTLSTLLAELLETHYGHEASDTPTEATDSLAGQPPVHSGNESSDGNTTTITNSGNDVAEAVSAAHFQSNVSSIERQRAAILLGNEGHLAARRALEHVLHTEPVLAPRPIVIHPGFEPATQSSSEAGNVLYIPGVGNVEVPPVDLGNDDDLSSNERTVQRSVGRSASAPEPSLDTQNTNALLHSNSDEEVDPPPYTSRRHHRIFPDTQSPEPVAGPSRLPDGFSAHHGPSNRFNVH